MTNPGLAMVGIRSTEGGHVDVLASDAAHHVGAGHEDPTLRCHDDDIGQCRPVRGTTGGEADHQRDLRDISGGPDHRFEHQAHRVQCLNAFGQAGSARVPDADDGALLFDSEVVGIDDVAAPVDAHSAAHDGPVSAERDRAQPVDRAGRGQDAGLVPLMQQFDAVIVEEGLQAQQWVARVQRFADRLRGHDRHLYLLVRVGRGWRAVHYSLFSTSRKRLRRCAHRIRTNC